MPYINVKSLPVVKKGFDISEALATISEDLSMTMDIERKHISVTWEYFDYGHYLVGDQFGHCHDPSHPLLVNVLVPDSNSPESIRKIMSSITASICFLGFEKDELFINLNLARSGMIFDRGRLVEW